MIQDIQPDFLENQYQNQEPQAHHRILFYQDRMLYLKNEDGQIQYPTYGEIVAYCEREERKIPRCRYLFSIGKDLYFTAMLEGIALDGFTFEKMFSIRAMKPKEAVFAGATGWHLCSWYLANKYCGMCRTRMDHDARLRMLSCPTCGNQVFPKIAPAVIVGVTDGDRILMTKYANREYTRYALIAGFVEIGETVEETVAREVLEEVGLPVKNITYYKSQPWGFDSNLLLGFFAEADHMQKIVLDEEELSVAEWVDYRDIKEDKEQLSLTAEMMQHFKQSRFA